MSQSSQEYYQVCEADNFAEEMLDNDPGYPEWADQYDKETFNERTKMNINDVYTSSSNFLRASDLQGKTIPLTIAAIGSHIFNEGKSDQKIQVTLSFEGKEKKLGLNATNARVIASLLGDETDMWIGKKIKIYPTKTDFAGEMVDCIRIVQDAPPEAGNFDEIPF